MTSSPSSRILTPEEIAARAGQQVPFVRLPERSTLFKARETRLRQLAAAHPMRDYLLFLAEVARGQDEVLAAHREVALPTAEQVDAAARAGVAPLEASRWRRDPAWIEGWRQLLEGLVPRLAGSPARATVDAWRRRPAIDVERQADRLLAGVMQGLDLGAAPLVAAALQAYYTHLVLATEEARGADRLAPFGRIDAKGSCPCCGTRPAASIVRIGGDENGYRYLHCGLCSAEWHLVRISCARCGSTKGIHYESLTARPTHVLPPTATAPDAVQAETCESCGHYLKLVNMAKDPHVDPVADDLASITLDLLMAESGRQRHGLNLLLLFGESEDDTADAQGPPIAASPGAA
jgi:FdhE protein